MASEVGIDHVKLGMLEDVAADGQSLVGGHKTYQILALLDHSSKKVAHIAKEIVQYVGILCYKRIRNCGLCQC